MTLPAGFIASADAALPLHVAEKSGFAAWRGAQPAHPLERRCHAQAPLSQ